MKNWQRFLDSVLGDPVAIENLRVWMGRLFDFKAPPPGRMLLLAGDSSSAHRLLLNLLCFLVGSARCARISPSMLEKNELLCLLDGCRLNIGDEQELFGTENEDLVVRDFYCRVNNPVFAGWVKRLLGQDLLMARDHDGKRPYGFMPDCALAGSCHSFSLSDDLQRDRELMARLLFIETRPEAGDVDCELFNKLKAEGDLIVAWAMAAIEPGGDLEPAGRAMKLPEDIDRGKKVVHCC